MRAAETEAFFELRNLFQNQCNIEVSTKTQKIRFS